MLRVRKEDPDWCAITLGALLGVAVYALWVCATANQGGRRIFILTRVSHGT